MTAELPLIVELCRASAKLGLNVAMSDARPAAVFRTLTGPSAWLTVGVSEGSYELHGTDNRHPVTDPVGAAAFILKYLTS
jgi:hypothetical protein